jgi:MFS family permease
VSTIPRGSLRELFGPATRTIVLAGLGASFLASFDLLIVVSALPSAARDVGDIHNYALAAGAYSVASVVGMPLAGAVNDRIGPLRTLLAGSGVFFVGTVLGGTATSMTQIAGGRLLQGFGGGFLLSVPLVLWTAYLPRHLERYGFAVNAAVWAISAVIGPPTGALLVALVDWRAVFWINLPLLALTVLFALRGFHGKVFTPHSHQRANIVGPFLLGGFALALLLPSPWPLVSIPLALTFFWQETHTDRPLIPRHRSGYAACIIALSAGIAFTGGTTVITLALQAGSGWSVFWASFPLLLASLAWTIGTGLVTHLAWSLRRIVAVGTFVVAAGTLAMAIPVSGGLAIAIGFTISGFGMGFASPALFPAALSDDEGREGRDTSAVTTARQLGAGIGAALAGFVLLETVPKAVLTAAQNGVSPLPELHDAAGLAFGLLGLIVLLSLPVTRGIRIAPRRSRAAAEEGVTTAGGRAPSVRRPSSRRRRS